ncbi:hypothetical protein EVAR_57182_1 [Eumeta japonica]|uniref:Uncharacterized protein n=1 Tax=Eumeta variegata TaxID=151549 RepID=A0A4C1Z4G6_EUMVA|nr:hypothetical protein EVAR_57182_1 [Eumeta japonica]
MREEHPSIATTKDNISTVWLMIGIDIRVTYQKFQISLGIGTSQVHKVLYEYLEIGSLTVWIVMLFSDIDPGPYRNGRRYLAPANDYHQRSAAPPS